ncbi:MAG: hypothetical protein JSS93_02610 [Bacteroidetes bacterium]|nr:hypothetical protein [Bacteroidota bacterium]MBS1559572.1 hypothetical protein [Bacteroidota bacterium]
MKRLLFSFFFIMAFSSKSQEIVRYQGKAEPVEFSVSPNQYFVTFKKENKDAIQHNALKFTKLSETTAVVTMTKDVRDFVRRKASVAQRFNDQVERIEPVLIYKWEVPEEEKWLKGSSTYLLKNLFV